MSKKNIPNKFTDESESLSYKSKDKNKSEESLGD